MRKDISVGAADAWHLWLRLSYFDQIIERLARAMLSHTILFSNFGVR